MSTEQNPLEREVARLQTLRLTSEIQTRLDKAVLAVERQELDIEGFMAEIQRCGLVVQARCPGLKFSIPRAWAAVRVTFPNMSTCVLHGPGGEKHTMRARRSPCRRITKLRLFGRKAKRHWSSYMLVEIDVQPVPPLERIEINHVIAREFLENELG